MFCNQRSGCVALFACVVLGCGADESKIEARNDSAKSAARLVASEGAMLPPASPTTFDMPAPTPTAPPTEQTKSEAPSVAVKAAPAESTRKIIYNAEIVLTVDNFEKSAQRIERLVKESGGFLSNSNQTGSPGALRQATWTVRVPVDRFDSFIDSILKVGELERRQTRSEDVTKVFYDTEARMKNKKVEEARLIKLLEDATGKLKEVLDVEREISRVRQEIESMQALLNNWSSLAALSTVTISINEVRAYAPVESASFGTRASRAFQNSTDGVVSTVQLWALSFVAFVPWLPFWLLVALVAWPFLRMLKRRIAGFRLPRQRQVTTSDSIT